LDQPGAILADEVGLGKTYVALGVAAWVLKNIPRSRVLVLTNSNAIVPAWMERWGAVLPRGWAKPVMERLRGYEDYVELVRSRGRRLATMSYESLKRLSANWDRIRVDIGRWLLEPRFHPGIRLSEATYREIQRALKIRTNSRPEPLNRDIPDEEARRWWRKHFDPEARCLRDDWEARYDLRNLELKYQPVLGDGGRKYGFDLVIIDEAHRFDSYGRRELIDVLLKETVRKFLHVTATPFALSVSQLENLLDTFGAGLSKRDREAHHKAVRGMQLKAFERSVGLGEPVTTRDSVERSLRRWIVRRTWEEEARGTASVEKLRKARIWKFPPDAGEGFMATLALERAIAEMHRVGNRTHIASRRTSLCSSWSSALASLESARFGARNDPAERFRRIAVEALVPVAASDSPKVKATAAAIARLVLSGRKVLLFAEREATLLSLQRHLRRLLSDQEHFARTQRKRLLELYRLGKMDALREKAPSFGDEKALKALIASLAGETPGAPATRKSVHRSAMRWLRGSGQQSERLSMLGDSFEGGRSIRSVEVYDGGRGNAATVNRFNLPGTPWVLLCSKRGQESIDLHVECNIVVLFDPVWNPAHREQRIGRVQRIGSRFRTVEVVDAITEGTYEEYTYRRAMSRARMMRVLLGAGRWLDEELEIANPEDYRLDLSPRSSLEQEVIRDAGG